MLPHEPRRVISSHLPSLSTSSRNQSQVNPFFKESQPWLYYSSMRLTILTLPQQSATPRKVFIIKLKKITLRNKTQSLLKSLNPKQA